METLTCKIYNYQQTRTLKTQKVPEGLSKDQIIAFGNALKSEIDSIHGATLSNPNVIRFIDSKGIFSSHMNRIVEYKN